jgi:hypothetical protein
MKESPRLEIRNRRFQEEGGVSRLEAELHNPMLAGLKDVVAEALLYDRAGNVVAASQTVLPELVPQSVVPLRFVWQRVFPEEPARIEVFYQVPPVN